MKKVFIYKSLSQKLRTWLDSPFARKGILFWLCSPILFVVSFVVFCVASLRRKRGYSRFESLPVVVPAHLHVLCVGNILMGGTGKSPIVRAIAESHLNEDHVVAIAARGIASSPVMIDSQNFNQNDVDRLSDENREHFELLRFKFPTKRFFIYQNKDRRKSLCEFIQFLGMNAAVKPRDDTSALRFDNVIPRLNRGIHSNKKYIFILDDGLQRFSCPRHENICVENAELLKTAPPFAFPVGPYREGFGRRSLEKIMETFDSVIIPCQDSIAPRGNRAIPWRGLGIYAYYRTQFITLTISANGQFGLQLIGAETLSENLNGTGLIITGIAHPERFLNDLKNSLPNFKDCDTLFLADHGELTSLCLDKIEHAQFLILTMKDFFRFCTHRKFLDLCSRCNVYSCYSEYQMCVNLK